MGDYYAAELKVEGWPSAATKVTPRPAYGGGTFEEEALHLPALEEKAEALRELAENTASQEEEREVSAQALRWEKLLSELRQEEPTDVTFTAEEGAATGELYALWSEASYGISALEGVRSALQELGLSYEAWDDGKYENPGQRVVWRPDLGEEREMTNAAEAGACLTESEWRELLRSSNGSLPELLKAVGDHFAWEPAPEPEPQPFGEIIEEAQAAFWARFAASYPEASTGDFPPDATFAFDEACERAGTTWLLFNHPEAAEEKRCPDGRETGQAFDALQAERARAGLAEGVSA